MDLDEYKRSLRNFKTEFQAIPGLNWSKPHLRPKYDEVGECIGWSLCWVASFPSNKFFVRFKENWILANEYERGFFSYHYGPYEEQWDLNKVEAKRVVVRIDAIDYSGRGYHIHDGSKERRIYQDELQTPELSSFTMTAFMEKVVAIRSGSSVATAFNLSYK